MRLGSGSSFRHALHAASMMASSLSKAVFESQFCQEDRGDVFGDIQLAGRISSGAIEKQHGVCALTDVARDLELSAAKFPLALERP